MPFNEADKPELSAQVPRELREKLKQQAEQLAGAALAPEACDYRESVLYYLDSQIDEHLSKITQLRETRRLVQYQSRHVAEIIHKLLQLRG